MKLKWDPVVYLCRTRAAEAALGGAVWCWGVPEGLGTDTAALCPPPCPCKGPTGIGSGLVERQSLAGSYNSVLEDTRSSSHPVWAQMSPTQTCTWGARAELSNPAHGHSDSWISQKYLWERETAERVNNLPFVSKKLHLDFWILPQIMHSEVKTLPPAKLMVMIWWSFNGSAPRPALKVPGVMGCCSAEYVGAGFILNYDNPLGTTCFKYL